jgi:hypothetical protein
MLVILQLANRGASPRSRGSTYEDWWNNMSTAEKIITVVVAAVLWLGACVIVGRSHPDWSLGMRLLAYTLLLFVADLYLLFFCARLVIAQARREPSVYSKLPRYAPILASAKRA